MDIRNVVETVSERIRKKQFTEATALLMETLAAASASGDSSAEEIVLSELVELSCFMEPPNLNKAAEFSDRRERLLGDAFGKLLTAQFLYHNAKEPARAIAKLREAIQLGRVENDEKTVYTSLALLGKCLLAQGNTSEAVAIVGEIERMATAKERFVVGDETWFLEDLDARGLERERIARLARTLAPVCRDPAFKQRLEALAKDA
jgi:hypothetical protein